MIKTPHPIKKTRFKIQWVFLGHAKSSVRVTELARKAALEIWLHSPGMNSAAHIFDRPRPTAAQWLALAVISTAALLSDQLTKQLIAARLAVGTTVEGIGPFWFSHTDNTGFALGLLSGRSWLVAAASALVILAAIAFFARSPRRWPGLLAVPLIVGGSAANLLDRVRDGHVTDIFGLHVLPVFNLADVFITTGVLLLVSAVAKGQLQRRQLSFRD
jgi:signal peptidase II